MFFGQTNLIFGRSERQKVIFQSTNVRNLFRNIQLPLDYIIMTLGHYLEATDEETWKKLWK